MTLQPSDEAGVPAGLNGAEAIHPDRPAADFRSPDAAGA